MLGFSDVKKARLPTFKDLPVTKYYFRYDNK